MFKTKHISSSLDLELKTMIRLYLDLSPIQNFRSRNILIFAVCWITLLMYQKLILIIPGASKKCEYICVIWVLQHF